MKMKNLTDDQIKEVLTKNHSRAAANLLETTTYGISKLRTKFNIPTPFVRKLAVRKFNLNHNFFSVIDSEAKAYVLGFLAADGNVNPDKYGCEIRIVLHPGDVDILRKINEVWESTYPIKIHKSTEKSGFAGTNREQVKLSIRSSQFQTDLAKYHIVPAKTHTVRFPVIHSDLERHYLRGILEGDGYVNNEAFGWTGNNTMTNDIQGICMRHGFPELRKYPMHNKISFSIKGGPAFHELIKWIYKDAQISLDRKQEQFNIHWKDRIYVPNNRAYPPLVKHIPCALEALPPIWGSMP